jgi:putative transcriptional regulator
VAAPEGGIARSAVKNRVRELREARQWSQVEFAALLGVSRQTVHFIETGKFDPSLPLAFRIARTFGRRIETIFDDAS